MCSIQQQVYPTPWLAIAVFAASLHQTCENQYEHKFESCKFKLSLHSPDKLLLTISSHFSVILMERSI